MDSAIDNICGWELNNPDPELFESQIVPQGEPEEHIPSDQCSGSCWSCKFIMKCIGAPQIRCLIPRDGKLYELGHEKTEYGDSITYFASERNGKIAFFRLTEPSVSWASIRHVEKDEVPDWAMSTLAS